MTPDDFAKFTDLVDQMVEMAKGFKVKLLEQGFREETAEAAALALIQLMLRKPG